MKVFVLDNKVTINVFKLFSSGDDWTLNRYRAYKNVKTINYKSVIYQLRPRWNIANFYALYLEEIQ